MPPPFRDRGIGEGPQRQYNTKSDSVQFLARSAAFLFGAQFSFDASAIRRNVFCAFAVVHTMHRVFYIAIR